jgi:hypothetical protein
VNSLDSQTRTGWQRAGHCRWGFGVVVALSLWASPLSVDAQQNFIRGDSNASGDHDFTDAINTLEFLFLGTGTLTCRDSADTDDSGDVDFTDAIFSLEFLFLGNQEIPPPTSCGSDPTSDSVSCVSFAACEETELTELTERHRNGHLLNRIAYGPTLADFELVTTLGIDGYIQQQLDPESLPENAQLVARLNALKDERTPTRAKVLVQPGSTWRYLKGTGPPPADWNERTFNDAGWASGAMPVGYGAPNVGNATVLSDMDNGYLTVFLRTTFTLSNPSATDILTIRADYVDGYQAYLNGAPLANRNSAGVNFDSPARSIHNSEGFRPTNVSSKIGLLVPGENVLAIQLQSAFLGRPHATIDVSLESEEITSNTTFIEYPTIENLKASVHLRGVFSTRRLQVVLADFWENHFTTDVDKLVAHFVELTNSDGTVAMTPEQAEREAATLEGKEYEFFLDNALGNFGDLLRFSARSPTMLVYLDNILNFKAIPNENYARELVELHTFGVDNGYLQRDIERIARVFTGWNLCKVAPESADDPHTSCGPVVGDRLLFNLGPVKYFKGNQNPTEDGGGNPTTAWTTIGFNDSSWIDGSLGIGYGDGDDQTILGDMRFNYQSVYVRRDFTVLDPDSQSSLVLEVNYDDGYVAYINGVEVARSVTMMGSGEPPAHDVLAAEERDITEGVQIVNINAAASLLVDGLNVFSAQVHNATLQSSDLSFAPRITERTSQGGFENGSQDGVWALSFLPDEHDYVAKNIFNNRPYELSIPTRPEGNPEFGLLDGEELLDKLVNAAPTAEYICTKLVQKLVDDSAPPDIVAEAIAAWNSTNPKGNIATVVEAILTSEGFFRIEYYRNKIKDPLEFVNSTARALEANINGFTSVDPMFDMGMHIFTRNDPDGWPELGLGDLGQHAASDRLRAGSDRGLYCRSSMEYAELSERQQSRHGAGDR